ncbi:Guanine nucleotide-binding protein alpha-2 subunit [Tulasnella sp. 424]|nr:Guanine nucleotide-binding protein alpha-2 subunit [Tulasnella sp. 424]
MSTEEKVERERSIAIDKQIEDDWKRMKKEHKVLVLGTQGSGKSTIVKQMKIMVGGYTSDEMAEFRLVIYTNLVHLAKTIIWTMRKIGMDCVEEINRTGAEKIFAYEVGSDPSFRLAPDVANAIESLWKDPVIAIVMDKWPHYSDSDLLDSASYFFSHVQRIAQRDYLPCERDVLNARMTADGIAETKFQLGGSSIRVLDTSGLSSERKKWIHCFEAVASIIFCAALSDYDQVLPETNYQNRMVESLILFESVVNSRKIDKSADE